MIAERIVGLILRAPFLDPSRWPGRGAPHRLERGWRAYFIEVVSGQVGPALEPLSGSWSIELNGTESGSVTVRKDDLHRIPGRWYAPWHAGVLFTYTHEGVERPIIAGPITGWPTETDDNLTLSFSGIRKIFEHRVVKNENANADVKFTGMALGDIAWGVVENAMAKPGGGLPIRRPGANEAVTPGHQRTYEWWNLANNVADKRLTELSEVINGPDLMFRPEWTSDAHTSIYWRFVHGHEYNPFIDQTAVPDWDATAERSPITGLSVRSSADNLVTRLWGTGAGTAAGTVIVNVTDDSFVREGGPMLESVFSDTDQTKADVLTSKAKGLIRGTGDMVDQVSFTVQASDPKTPLGTWFVGDAAKVTLSGLLAVPDGTRAMRVIQASGGLDESVTVQFLEDTFD